MDKYSFLNSANTAYFAELYDQYLKSPDTVEPSWRAFFQGFDFGQENGTSQIEVNNLVPENIKKEFQVVKLIDAYRNRGHLFTKTNPVRARRSYSPNLDFQNFGISREFENPHIKLKSLHARGLGNCEILRIKKNSWMRIPYISCTYFKTGFVATYFIDQVNGFENPLVIL